MPRTVPVIVTAPDGTEYRFSSCKAAGELVGASGSNVSQQCVIGNPIHGYRVRYAHKNKMGQLMEMDNADCPMCCDFRSVADVPGVCRFEEREVIMPKIKDYLPEAEILAQLAEEASELAQAALKLRRVLDGTNPTPVSREIAEANLIEEYGDVVCCLRELDVMYDVSLLIKKKDRWIERLKEKANEQS